MLVSMLYGSGGEAKEDRFAHKPLQLGPVVEARPSCGTMSFSVTSDPLSGGVAL